MAAFNGIHANGRKQSLLMREEQNKNRKHWNSHVLSVRDVESEFIKNFEAIKKLEKEIIEWRSIQNWAVNILEWEFEYQRLESCIEILNESQDVLRTDLAGLWRAAPSVESVHLASFIDNWTKVTLPDNEGWNLNDEYFCLPYSVLKGTGFEHPIESQDLILYNREYCRKQIQFIQETVLDQGKRGYIAGQSGSGKSIMTFYTACHYSHNWDWGVVWIQLKHRADLGLIVDISKGAVRQFKVPIDFLKHHLHKLPLNLSNKQIIILDSFDIHGVDYPITYAALKWVKENPETRRIICVSSLDYSAKLSDQDMQEFKRFRIGAWSLDEYQQAVKNERFWNSVKHAFSECDGFDINRSDNLDERIRLLQFKYYFGGTSARFTLRDSLSDLKRRIGTTIGSVSFKTLQGMVDEEYLRHVKHRLSTYIRNAWIDGGLEYAGYVSEYVALHVALKCPFENFIKLAGNWETLKNNRTIWGWFFKAIFFGYAQSGRLNAVKPIDNRMSSIDLNPKGEFKVYSSESGEIHNLPLNTWCRPSPKYQHGFDGVMLLSCGTIWFVKISVERSHDLQMGELANFATLLLNAGYKILEAEIFFVIPDYCATHTVSGLHEWEKFTSLFASWPTSYEKVREKIKIVTIPAIP
jgi:hypothetical protein